MWGTIIKEDNLKVVKKKLYKIFGVALTVMLLASLSIGLAAPAAANPDLPDLDAANAWNAVGLPATEPDSDVGPMAVAPDGTIYASVRYYDEVEDAWYWQVMKSEDDGYTWDATELVLVYSDDNCPVQICVSPNYEEDETVYVGTYGGTVYRLEEAGADWTALKTIIDSYAQTADELYSMDVWTDEDDTNWILVGTDIDAFVLADGVFEAWRDQEIVPPTAYNQVYDVAFAPDFDDSELIWAITDDTPNDNPWHWSGDYVVSATKSPGQWGWEIGDAYLELGVYGVDAYPWCDLDFPDNYDSEPASGDCIVFAGVSSDDDRGDVYLIYGVDAADGDSNAIALMDLAGEDFAGTSIVSIAVSGDYPECVILAGALESPEVFISADGGEDWSTADKNPTGFYPFDPSFYGVPDNGHLPDDGYFSWTHVYMEADVVWGGAVFDPAENVSFVSTVGFESAVSRSYPNEDGDLLYNQVGLIDTEIEEIFDIAFSPDYPDTPTFLMLTGYFDGYQTASLWLTENGDSDEPDYIRVLCGGWYGWDGLPGNFDAYFGPIDSVGSGLVEFAQDGSAIYLYGEDYTTDNLSIWKSTDGGQTFGSRRAVKSAGDEAWIFDWVITDAKTIYAAVDSGGANGFYKTTNSGLSWSAADTDEPMNSIALSPDFDAAEEVGYICLGGFDGEVLLSDDVGDIFDDTGLTATDVEGLVYVAFDADFAVDDADGYMLIYAAGEGDIMVGEVADTDDVDWDALEDDTDEAAQAIVCTGLQVADDNALYANGVVTEVTVTAVTVDGTIDILSDSDAEGTVDIVDLKLTVLTGTFEDGESVTHVDENLTIDVIGSNVTVSGYIWVEGVVSEATGRFALVDAPVTPSDTFTDGEGATVDESDLDVGAGVVAEAGGMARLLLHEDDSIWELAADDDLGVPFGLWLTPGSNVLWTINAVEFDPELDVGPELWVFEDLLSGQVTLESPADKAKLDREDIATLMWTALDDADEYGYEYNSTWTLATKSGTTDEVWIGITGLSASDTYEWRARVLPGEPFSSRWSDTWTFGTALGASPWAPECIAPGNGDTGVPLSPAFSWESAKAADAFEFVLATDSAFTAVLVTETVSTDAFQPAVTLEYDTNYYWKVRALKAAVAISRWSDISVFTTAAEVVAPAEVWTCPLDGLTFDSQAALQAHNAAAHAPVVPLTPAYIWAIVIIGAILVIAVIVLIVTTRRVP